jgi:hypothetical protein
MFKQRQSAVAEPKRGSRPPVDAGSAKALAAQLSATDTLRLTGTVSAGGGAASAGAPEAVPGYFQRKNLEDRIKQYAAESGHKKVADFLKQYEKDQQEKVLSLSDDEDSDKGDFPDIDNDSS